MPSPTSVSATSCDARPWSTSPGPGLTTCRRVPWSRAMRARNAESTTVPRRIVVVPFGPGRVRSRLIIAPSATFSSSTPIVKVLRSTLEAPSPRTIISAAWDPGRSLAHGVDGLDHRSNVPEAERMLLLVVRIDVRLRHVVGTEHPVITDLLEDPHGLVEVDVSVIGIDLVEVE